MAGFRIGRGRDNNRTPQQPPRQQPYGAQQPPYEQPPYPRQGPPQQQRWPRQQPPGPQGGGGYAAHGGHGGGQGGEPEYFDPYDDRGGRPPQPPRPPYGQDPYQGGGRGPDPYGHDPYGRDPHGRPPQGHDPYAGDPYRGGGRPPGPGGHGDDPGHTRAFAVGEEPYGPGDTYHAGGGAPVPSGPRLPWKELLRGIVTRPGPTFLRMRDHAVWGPALIVTFVYGLLAVFSLDEPRDQVIKATIGQAVPIVLSTGVAFVICGLLLGAVTHTLARQLGGDGSWQPTVGLSMLVMTITDVPRLIFAIFLGGTNLFVVVLGWLTWIMAGFLFTLLIRDSHDLPWPKALGASAIQLVALLSLIKLGAV
ncbi:Yip1 family protein [Streptomyces sp. BI20]|uniref:Yip1 family protein n=1 Tax=Streptomyces sp. BI20 TaxID=3403460 RepID=UPI003C78683B